MVGTEKRAHPLSRRRKIVDTADILTLSFELEYSLLSELCLCRKSSHGVPGNLSLAPSCHVSNKSGRGVYACTRKDDENVTVCEVGLCPHVEFL